MIKKTLAISCFVFLIYHIEASNNMIFGSKDSTIQLGYGSSFIFENPMSGIDGKIVKDSNATLGGTEISFSQGSLNDGGNKLKMSGTLAAEEDVILLNGDQTFSGGNGSLHKPILVHGKNNRIEGSLTVASDILLDDSNTTVSIDLLGNLKGNLFLNGGSLYLGENNLKFDDKKRIVGPGKIYLNGNKLIFGAKELTFSEPLYFVDAGDVQICDCANIESAWTFSGDCTLEGGNNFICLLKDCAKIIIERGASALFKNTIMHGVHTDNFFCMDNYSTISFQNSDIYFDADFTFSKGHFDILNLVKFWGDNCKFIYNTTMPSSIMSKATLSLESGMTFSYDPGNMRKDLIVFQDDQACLNLNGAVLHATLTGMQLTKGSLFVNHNSYLESEKNSALDEGITFGNDNSNDDLYCEILKSSKLELLSGSLKYRNISNSAWSMENYVSELNINAGCNLYLYQNLNLGDGTMNYKGRGGFYSAPGKNLTGTFNVIGYVDYYQIN